MKALKALGMALIGALVVAAIAVGGLYLTSNRRMARHYDVAPERVAVPTDADSIARGAHIATLRGCNDCHGADLSGKLFVDDAMLGRFYTPNLTAGAGGVGKAFTVADWERALRHGVAPDGRGLLIMPALEISVLDDDDLGALIAYLHSLPAIDQAWPASQAGPLGRALLEFDVVPMIPAERIDHTAPHEKAPAVGITPEYGGYLAVTCTGCHKEDFAGGSIPGTHGAIAANLTMDEATGLGKWTEADFDKAMRTGTRPDGSQLNPVMPLRLTASMTDVEVSAIWQYLRTLPVQPARTN